MALDVKTMKKLFAAMSDANVAGFEYTEHGVTIKVAMHETEAIETDARSVGFVTAAEPTDTDDEDEEIEAKRKLGFVPDVVSKPGLYDSRTLHLKDFDN